VTAIRGDRLKKKIDKLAGGRVYTGQQALKFGLVDKIGTLNDAVEHVAKQAKLKDYEVRVVPRPKNFMEQLLDELTDKQDDQSGLSTSLALPAAGGSMSLLEAAMPYLNGLDPQRLDALKMTLRRLGLLRKEHVILMMPEIYIRN